MRQLAETEGPAAVRRTFKGFAEPQSVFEIKAVGEEESSLSN
jgi:hypothetical protein